MSFGILRMLLNKRSALSTAVADCKERPFTSKTQWFVRITISLGDFEPCSPLDRKTRAQSRKAGSRLSSRRVPDIWLSSIKHRCDTADILPTTTKKGIGNDADAASCSRTHSKSLEEEEDSGSEEIDPELAIAMRERKREEKKEEKRERKRVKKAMKEAAAAGEPTRKRKLTDRESETPGSSKRARGTETAPPPPRLDGSENDDVLEQERENGIARNTAAVEYAGNGQQVAPQKAQPNLRKTQGSPRLSAPETDAESTDSRDWRKCWLV
ncbi:hypothetical protein B0H13DRAFT_2420165 [Mycena leptocephala]|nr:hypothetical protein B0H13DRAFT_2420165 [Mycena leptocephala]